MYFRLRDAFLLRDPGRILKLSAELGHYVGDAHVPLHTTENYNGQLSGQEGIHAFWESRLPELFSGDYDFFVGRAQRIDNPQLSAWAAVSSAHIAVDSVLMMEKQLSLKMKEKKYSFETRGKQTIKVYSQAYASAYEKLLRGMVERQMRSAIRMIGDLWFTAWVEAGQPDLSALINYTPTPQELLERQTELNQWKEKKLLSRPHEVDN
jgi:hypothetical protein